MNTESVRGILDDKKTQTRRIVKPQPIWHPKRRFWALDQIVKGHSFTWEEGLIPNAPIKYCPYGKIGDRLWVRETWTPWRGILCPCSGYCNCDKYLYKADPDTDFANKCERPNERIRWKPSIFMPHIVSRILLEITDIRVERVQDIILDEIKAEGIKIQDLQDLTLARERFINLWNSINAKRGYGWNINPWIWVIVFKVLKKEV